MKKYLLLAIILLPTFVRLIRPGIYSMQDFPYFRLVEYHTCFVDKQFPCRWAASAGFGFGEPVFNFYSHLPFFTGAVLMNLGIGGLSSLKILFALSLLLSGFGMFLLSKKVWKNDYSAFLSAVLYVYAPYRAVNVWVRGALPESFAFILLPLILLTFEHYKDTKKTIWLTSFSLLLSALILTHNLSVLLFAPAVLCFIAIRLFSARSVRLFLPLMVAGVFSLLLSAFYLLPAIGEAPLVNLQTTTQGYFDFRAHFVTVPQLLFSRFWGYGGSTWGDQDGLSLAIGQVQWLTAAFVICIALFNTFKGKKDKNLLLAFGLFLVALFCLFLTHNKSAFLWEATSSFTQYIQFPWRFLGVTLFLFSFVAGYVPYCLPKYTRGITIILILLAIGLNSFYFKEDIWRNVSDHDMQTGSTWIEQTSASRGDYWPKYGPIPNDPPILMKGLKEISRTSNSAHFEYNSAIADELSIPITFYPGWSGMVNGKSVTLTPDTAGLISLPVVSGNNVVELQLESTLIQKLGNSISSITLLIVLLFSGYVVHKQKK